MISIMVETLTNPARLLDRFGISGAPGDGVRKILGRANRFAVALGRSPNEWGSFARSSRRSWSTRRPSLSRCGRMRC